MKGKVLLCVSSQLWPTAYWGAKRGARWVARERARRAVVLCDDDARRQVKVIRCTYTNTLRPDLSGGGGDGGGGGQSVRAPDNVAHDLRHRHIPALAAHDERLIQTQSSVRLIGRNDLLVK